MRELTISLPKTLVCEESAIITNSHIVASSQLHMTVKLLLELEFITPSPLPTPIPTS